MKKVLIGCAIVAGVFVLLSVGTGLGFYFWVKSEIPDMQHAKDARRDLAERYGHRDDYVPDVQLRPERVEIFLAVRESLLAPRAAIGGRAQSFLERAKTRSAEDRGVVRKIADGIRVARGGLSLFRAGTEYAGLRAGKLLAAGMGEGEYTWLYGLMSFAWVRWDVQTELGDQWFVDHDMEEVPDELMGQHRRLFTRQLRNQRRALEAKTPRTPAEDEALARARDALGSGSGGGAFAFQGALPAEWVAILEPQRARFTATLPRTPGEFLVESVEQLAEEDRKGLRFEVNSERHARDKESGDEP